MRNFIKKILGTILPGVWRRLRRSKLHRRMQADPNSFLNATGFYRSYDAGIPCRADGRPLPWMNYALVAFLDERLHKELTVFEYGSGFSTLYLSDKVATIYSIEHNSDWIKRVNEMTQHLDNVHVDYCELEYGGTYHRAAVDNGRKFDLIIVDGRDRSRCAEVAPQALSPAGVVLVDDSHRQNYQPGMATLTAAGFRRLDFRGLKPNGFGIEQSSIFYRDGNCLGL